MCDIVLHEATETETHTMLSYIILKHKCKSAFTFASVLFQRACQQNKPDAVEFLLEAGADPQYRHKDTENVALHEAAALGHSECVQVRETRDRVAMTLRLKIWRGYCGAVCRAQSFSSE